jgi:hypothetical protein
VGTNQSLLSQFPHHRLGLLPRLRRRGDAGKRALGDPALRDQISAAVGDAKTAGRILLGISVVTIIARLRSLQKAA